MHSPSSKVFLPKVFFPKVFFPKVFFPKVFFPKVFFPKVFVFLPKVFFPKVYLMYINLHLFPYGRMKSCVILFDKLVYIEVETCSSFFWTNKGGNEMTAFELLYSCQCSIFVKMTFCVIHLICWSIIKLTNFCSFVSLAFQYFTVNIIWVFSREFLHFSVQCCKIVKYDSFFAVQHLLLKAKPRVREVDIYWSGWFFLIFLTFV